jgi:hypothetical protein
MSSNKRYNQILFLMTISVYMGLVLAGGASPALAQAAMAKGFELKTELEAKDDLDKKPDEVEDLKQLSRDFEDYLIESRDLIAAMQKLHSSGDFDFAKDTFHYTALNVFPCNTDLASVNQSKLDIARDFPNRSIEKDADSVIGTALRLGRLAECGPSTFDENKKASSVSVGVSYNYLKSNLRFGVALKLKKSLGNAQGITEALFATFNNFQAKENSPAAKALAKNTEITSDNEYISIITNLPRAGLDPLLTAGK